MPQLNRLFALLIIISMFAMIPIINAESPCNDGEWLIDGICTTLDSSFEDGWHTIELGGETRCAHDTDYRMWFKPGNDDVLLFFQGGGGCWNQETCEQGSTFYKQSAGLNEPENYHNGIFDFDNPDNPFVDHSIIFAPSCTGDVYMGSGVIDYGNDVIVHHRGYDNLMTAINFTLDYAPEPDSVFTTGCSAGSVGSAMAVPYLIEAYPDIPVTQLGDSLGLIFDTETVMSDFWGIPNFYTGALSDYAPDFEAFTMAKYYIALGNAYPDNHFAQFNYRTDRVQQRFFAIGEENPADFVETGLIASLTQISDSLDNFSYFLAVANSHCITPSSDLYHRTAGDVSALDWIGSIATGENTTSVEE